MFFALALGGCEGPLSTLDPAGRSAAAIADLWWVLLAGAAVIFVGVLSTALFALLRRRPGRSTSERVMLIGGGLVFPSVVLLALTIAALLVGDRLSPRGERGVLVFDAVAEQWRWTFKRPDRPAAPPSVGVLNVPVGRPFEVRVTSRDVIHSFWAPRLGGKIDAIPGHVNTIRLQADAPGRHLGRCAEFCGVGHTEMGFEIHAHAPADYERMLAGTTP